MNFTVIIIICTFMATGVFFLALGTYAKYKNFPQYKGWDQTRATVVQHKTAGSSGMIVPIVEFDAGGKTVTAEAEEVLKRDTPYIGEVVTISYKKNDPDSVKPGEYTALFDNYLDYQSGFALTLLSMIGASLCVVAFFLIFGIIL